MKPSHLLPAATAALISSASCQTVIRIIGSQEDQASVQTAISNLLSESEGGPSGHGWFFQGPEGGRLVSDPDSVKTATKANFGVWKGDFEGSPLIIKVSFPGVFSAISSLSGQDNFRFPATPDFSSSNLDDPRTSSDPASVDLAKPDFGFSSVFQATTPFLGNYKGRNYPPLVEEITGITPIRFFATPGFPAEGANITDSRLRLLYLTGSFNLSLQTGDPPRDRNTIVYALASSPETGSRLGAMANIGLGTQQVIQTWDPRIPGQPGFPGNHIPSHDLWPSATIAGVTTPTGHAGFSDERSMAPYLASFLAPGAFRTVINDPEEGTFALYPDATAGHYIGHLSNIDAIQRISGLRSPLAPGDQAVPLSYNGVPFSDDNVRSGLYTPWLYNRIIKPPTGLGGIKLTFANALRDRIRRFDATAGGGILDDYRFLMKRYADGGLVVPNDSKFIDSDGDGLSDAYEWYLIRLDPNDNLNTFADVIPPSDPRWNDRDDDGDGNPNYLDIDPTDASDTGEILPVSRFALFPIFGGRPLAISDKGTVLLHNATWRAGDLKPVRGTAAAINDHDQILSLDTHTFTYTGPDGKSHSTNPIVHYFSKSHGGSAEAVADSSGYHAGAYSTFTDEARGLLSNDGVFTANSIIYGHEQPPDGHNAFRVRSNGSATRLTRPPEIFFSLDDDLSWGFGSVIIRGKTTFGSPSVAIRDGKNESIVRSLGTGGAFKHYNNRWQPDPRYDWAVDIAKDGIAIGRYEKNTPGVADDLKLPLIHINGRWFPFHQAVPGAGDWGDKTSLFLDMSPSGWAILRQGKETYNFSGGQMFLDPDYPEMRTGVLMPVRVAAHPPSGTSPGATGVDDFSLGADDSDTAVGDKLWIMAPSGADHTTFRLESLASLTNILTLSADGATVQPASVNTPKILVKIGGSDPSKTGRETHLKLTLGNAESASQPIGVKLMKQRTVRVTVYKIARQRPSGNIEDPDLIPTKEELEAHLNGIYGPQINVRFNVTLHPAIIPVNWDANGNHTFDEQDEWDELSPDQQSIVSALPAETNPPSHIRICLVSSTILLGTKPDAVGITHQPSATCWVLGTPARGNQTLFDQMETIAHEIGHIFFGYGHPNNHGARQGPAPLPGTKHGYRLMREGTTPAINGGHLLVKQEWDVAEMWLKPKIDSPQ